MSSSLKTLGAARTLCGTARPSPSFLLLSQQSQRKAYSSEPPPGFHHVPKGNTTNVQPSKPSPFASPFYTAPSSSATPSTSEPSPNPSASSADPSSASPRANPFLDPFSPPPKAPTAGRVYLNEDGTQFNLAQAIWAYVKKSSRILTFNDPYAWRPPPGWVDPNPKWHGWVWKGGLFGTFLSIGSYCDHLIDEKYTKRPSALRKLVNFIVPGSWPYPAKRSKKRPKPVEAAKENETVVPKVDEEIVLASPPASS